MGIEDVFSEFALLLAVAAVLGLLVHLLRQPLIIAYIAVGILVGPSAFGWGSIGREIELLSKTGIGLLLFSRPQVKLPAGAGGFDAIVLGMIVASFLLFPPRGCRRQGLARTFASRGVQSFGRTVCPR